MTIGLLVTVVLFPLVGLAVGRLVGPVQPFLAGAGAIGAIVFVASVLHAPLVATLIVLVVAAIVVLIVKRAPRREPASYPLLPTCIAAAIIFVLLAIAAIVPLEDYDGRAFWLLKAKAIAFDRSVDGAFFHQRETLDPRNQYPLLVPIDAATLLIAGRELDDRHVRWLYVFFAAGFALELRRRIGTLCSPALGAWSAAVFLALPAIVNPAIGALSAGADIVLGAFAACAFFEIVEARSPLRLGLWLSFVALTKSEGLPLALLLFLIAAFVFRRRIAVAAVPLFIAIGTLLAWRSGVPSSDEQPVVRQIVTIPRHVHELVLYLVRFAHQSMAFESWGALWIAFFIAIVVLALRRERRTLLLVGATMLPMITLYAAVVAVSGWDPIAFESGAPRLLTHLLAPAFYAVSVSLLDGMPNERL